MEEKVYILYHKGEFPVTIMRKDGKGITIYPKQSILCKELVPRLKRLEKQGIIKITRRD